MAIYPETVGKCTKIIKGKKCGGNVIEIREADKINDFIIGPGPNVKNFFIGPKQPRGEFIIGPGHVVGYRCTKCDAKYSTPPFEIDAKTLKKFSRRFRLP